MTRSSLKDFISIILVATYNITKRDKDVYCVCTHGLLVSTHGNFKSNVYHVHIKNSSTYPFFNLMRTWIKYQGNSLGILAFII